MKKMKIIGFVEVLSLLLMLLVIACSPQAVQTTAVPSVPAAKKPPSFQQEWDDLVKAAQKEGTLTIYSSSGPDVRKALNDGFKEKYNIDIDWVVGRGAETAAKLKTERNAGLFLADVYLEGTSGTLADLVNANVFDELPPIIVLPEVTGANIWMNNKLHYVDKGQKYIVIQTGTPTPGVIVNTELVKRNEVQSFQDILNPKWKGKLSMEDPTTPGAGARWFRSVSDIMGIDFLKELTKQEPMITRDNRLRFEQVAHGKYLLTLSHSTDIYNEFRKVGVPIAAYYLKEGSWLTGRSSGISIINRAPHVNSAKVFINWLLTKEGQTFYSRASGTESLRVDVPKDHLSQEEIRQPGMKYIDVENEAYLEKDPEYRTQAKEIFKALMQ